MAAGTYRTTLTRPGLWPFLWTQFLGAFNDNVFKIIVILLAATAPGRDATRDVALAGAVFIAPFLLFSGYAGDIADRFGKRARDRRDEDLRDRRDGARDRRRSRPAASTLQLAVLFLMGAQATFFSPAKYGIVPELVPDEDLSRANGLLEMSTFLAIVLGTAIGGPLLVRLARPAVVDWRRPHRRSPSAARRRACAFRACPPLARRGRIAINPFGEVWRGRSAGCGPIARCG